MSCAYVCRVAMSAAARIRSTRMRCSTSLQPDTPSSLRSSAPKPGDGAIWTGATSIPCQARCRRDAPRWGRSSIGCGNRDSASMPPRSVDFMLLAGRFPQTPHLEISRPAVHSFFGPTRHDGGMGMRNAGASFALNAMIEAERVILLEGEPEVVNTPSNSGKGQKISRCPKCRIALWSTYAGAGDAVRFVRVGTLKEPDRLPPDIHIFTSSKQRWVVLPPDTPAVAE